MRTEIPNALVTPKVTADQHLLGATTQIQEPVLSHGQWLDRLPRAEHQKRRVETMACTSFHTLNPVEILLHVQYDKRINYSDRYLAIRSGTRPTGNDPHTVVETMRKYAGAVPEETLQNNAATWNDYYSGINYGHRRLGFNWLWGWELNHDWVLLPNTKYSPTRRQTLLAEALKFSPLGVAVDAWEEEDDLYVKRKRANHWTTLVGYDPGKCWYVFDSYKPYIKRLDWNYEFEYAKRYRVTHRSVHSLKFLVRAYSGLFGLQ